MHGGNRVAGVDRALEGVSAFNADDLGDLINVQQGSNARQVVFAVGAGRSQDVAVTLAQFSDQQGNVFRQQVRVGSIVSQQDLVDASDFGSSVGNSGTACAGNQNVDVATDGLGGCNGVQGSCVQLGVVVFSNNQNAHVQITLASFLSLSTSSSTLLTLMPALRAAGASTFRVETVEAVLTPRSSGLRVSSGFFLAFMMFGSDA